MWGKKGDTEKKEEEEQGVFKCAEKEMLKDKLKRGMNRGQAASSFIGGRERENKSIAREKEAMH